MNDTTSYSDAPRDIIKHLVQEGMAAISYYEVYSVLGRKEYFAQQRILDNDNYKDFFHVSHTAHYKMIFIALGKIFDKGSETASIEKLKKVLKNEKRNDLITYIEEKLGSQTEICKRIQAIRNKSIAHNQRNPSKEEIYEDNPVTPNELYCLINETCEVINYLALEFGLSGMSMSGRAKKSMLKVLEVLNRPGNFGDLLV